MISFSFGSGVSLLGGPVARVGLVPSLGSRSRFHLASLFC